MRTGIIQIGNSDDKLTQKEWSDFIHRVEQVLVNTPVSIHFSGGSPADTPWQNYCFVFNIHDDVLPYFRGRISPLASDFNQDSIALTIGETEFVK